MNEALRIANGAIPREAYELAFEKERRQEYPAIDAFEREAGFAVDRDRLEEAARVLACPVKVNPPNWQHGRVLYAALLRYAAHVPPGTFLNVIDVGTAKGFSALCMEWALADASRVENYRMGEVTSIDVVDPKEVRIRNSVAEAIAGGALSLPEVLHDWPEASRISFRKADGGTFLAAHGDRVHFAFLDGKHRYDAVHKELTHLCRRQGKGDVVVLDDMQVPGVSEALAGFTGKYDVEALPLKPGRAYAIATRR